MIKETTGRRETGGGIGKLFLKNGSTPPLPWHLATLLLRQRNILRPLHVLIRRRTILRRGIRIRRRGNLRRGIRIRWRGNLRRRRRNRWRRWLSRGGGDDEVHRHWTLQPERLVHGGERVASDPE